MFRLKKGTVLLAIGLMFFLSGCGLIGAFDRSDAGKETAKNTEQEKTEPKKEKPADYLNPVKDNLEWILYEPAGKFAGSNFNKQKVVAELSKTSLDAEEKDNYYKLVELMGEDYGKYADLYKNFDTKAPKPTPKPKIDSATGQIVPGKLNVEILLDASGSMGQQIDSNTKMELAKQAINNFLSGMPSNVNVSLRVYGHKGSSGEADKVESCQSTEVVYPLKNYNSSSFQSALQQVQPSGWTPLAKAIQQAQQDLKSQTDALNIVYVVSDGIETCGGDPVAAAKALNKSDIKGIINIIGFNVDDAGQEALRKIADAGEGKYSTVETEKDLKQYFKNEKERLNNAWEIWYNYNRSKAEDSYDRRYEEIKKAYEEFYALIEEEYDRMYDVCDSTPGCGSETRSIIYKRSSLLKKFAYDEYSDIKKELYDHMSQAKKEYYEIYKEEKRKINN